MCAWLRSAGAHALVITSFKKKKKNGTSRFTVTSTGVAARSEYPGKKMKKEGPVSACDGRSTRFHIFILFIVYSEGVLSVCVYVPPVNTPSIQASAVRSGLWPPCPNQFVPLLSFYHEVWVEYATIFFFFFVVA